MPNPELLLAALLLASLSIQLVVLVLAGAQRKRRTPPPAPEPEPQPEPEPEPQPIVVDRHRVRLNSVDFPLGKRTEHLVCDEHDDCRFVAVLERAE
jgi:hypothetical protein